MDSGFQSRQRFRFYKRNRRWLVMLAVAGVSSYGVYKVCCLPSVIRRRTRLMKMVELLNSVATVASDSAEAMDVLVRDLKVFLESDSDEIPRSLRQISKFARSPELSESLVRVSEALTVGILRASRSGDGDKFASSGSSGTGFLEKIMQKMFSDAGTGFVSVVVGSFAKNLVLGFYASARERDDRQASDESHWIGVICDDDKCKELILNSVERLVSTAVSVFLEKTMHINTYDDFFAGLTNPKHQNNVRDVLVAVCNKAMETLVKTSHHVLISSAKSSIVEQDGPPLRARKNSFNGGQKGGWVDQVSSTLAVPSNRKFVLDVTGRVTFETVRSIFEFLLFKIADGVQKSLRVAHDEVVCRGMEVVRYAGAKSVIILTICLALYLHILAGTKAVLSDR